MTLAPRLAVALGTTLLLLFTSGVTAQEGLRPPRHVGRQGETGRALRLPSARQGDVNAAPEAPNIDTRVAIERISGENRYATAGVLATVFEAGGTVFVSNGERFPDALAGGPAATVANAPIVLVTGAEIPADTRSALHALRPSRIKLLGGTAAVSQSVEDQMGQWAPVDRIAGEDRYETAAALARSAFPSGARGVLVATGRDFPDALSGATRGAARSDPLPILLVEPTSVPESTRRELQRLQPTFIAILGGPSVVSEEVATQLRGLAPTVDRIAGETRFGTSARLAGGYDGADHGVIFLAAGHNFPDALAAAPVAGLFDSPTVLVPRQGPLPPETASTLRQFTGARHIVAVGGTAALDDALLEEVGEMFNGAEGRLKADSG